MFLLELFSRLGLELLQREREHNLSVYHIATLPFSADGTSVDSKKATRRTTEDNADGFQLSYACQVKDIS